MIEYLKKIIRIYFIIKKVFSFIPYKGLKKYDIIIYDDIYPHPISGFRLEEFTVLLKIFQNSKIVMSPTSYPIVKTPAIEHKSHVESLLQKKTDLKGKLKFYKGFVNINSRLFYCVFVNNIYNYLGILEKYKIPFVFTLYPGGGFQIMDEFCYMKLKKIFSSPMFKKVIVTQKFTKNYLIDKKLCRSQNIEFIFGGVVPQLSLKKDLINKKRFSIDKETLDICFCAAKYMPKGEDKGYDVFIKLAHKLAKKYNFIQFHVIGGFTENEIDITKLNNQIQFYGYQKFENLEYIYREMDIIISPNRPFLLGKGAFDGFPLGTVVEAVLSGVVALVSDELNQNSVFNVNEEIIIIDNNIDSIENIIIDLLNNPNKLKDISIKGREKFQQIYSNEFQMKPRIAILQNVINKI